jgi:predicted site-specific integrase-resolvase
MRKKISKPVSAAELARIAGVWRGTVSRQCQAGKIKAIKVAGTWVIQPEEAQRYIESRRVPVESAT